MFTEQDNLVFDRILECRHICRKFDGQVPSREEVAAVIRAGQLAPYAYISSRDVLVFLHFFVLFKGNPLLAEIERLIREQTAANLAGLREEMARDLFLREYGGPLEAMWAGEVKNGLPVFPDPPCLIVLAQWRGARRGERQSLAHALENMWLKATALNLDFNLISPVESMVDNAAFCSLFGLPAGRYGFHACILGHRADRELSARPVSSQIHWL